MRRPHDALILRSFGSKDCFVFRTWVFGVVYDRSGIRLSVNVNRKGCCFRAVLGLAQFEFLVVRRLPVTAFTGHVALSIEEASGRIIHTAQEIRVEILVATVSKKTSQCPPTSKSIRNADS